MGYLDAGGSLSGTVKLRADLAEAAIDEHLAQPLGLSVIEAADGIHRIVCEHMAAAAKIHAVENGRDVRHCTLLAFGGAGPLHAREVARRAGCRKMLIPANAGVFSAFGLLVAPIKMDAVRTRFTRLDGIDWGAIKGLCDDLQSGLAAQLVASGIPLEAIHFERSADMRYLGQGFEVETPLPARLDAAARGEIEAAFERAYASRFGRSLAHQRIEIVNWRVEASVAIEAPRSLRGAEAEPAARSTNLAPMAASRTRRAYFPELAGFIDTPVIAEADLRPGQTMTGPALIEQSGSTVVIGPGDQFGLDQAGNIRVTLAGTAG